MGNNIYYGVYSKECNNDKVLPYLSMYPEGDVTDELYISKDSQEEFFDILRKYSIEKHDMENDPYYYHCFIITNYKDYFNFYGEVGMILHEDIMESDFYNNILIFWVA